MRRLIAVALALWCGQAVAADVPIDTTCLQGSASASVCDLFDDEAVASTATVTSNAVDLRFSRYFGAHYQCTSATGTPDVDIVWEEASVSRDSAAFVAVVTVADDLTAETWGLASIQPPPARYGRLSITGNAGNPADTICTVSVFRQG